MKLSFLIREARKADAGILSKVAIASKAYWGYSDEFMAACEDELTVHVSQIDGHWVAESDAGVLGFYALQKISGVDHELDALFVDPKCIGMGVGRALYDHALAMSLSLGATKLLIQSDPYAASFYKNLGAVLVGEKESVSIPGRMLPKFEVALH